MYPFIHKHRSEHGVEKMCRVLAIPRSGYYAWRKRSQSKRQQANNDLLGHIRRVHRLGRGGYGSPRVTKALHAEGIRCGKNRVARLMKADGLQGVAKRKFKVTTDSRHGFPVADNLLNRDFTADRPNQVWVSDITYVLTHEGWLYLAAIMDLYSRQIVGWAMDRTMTQELAIKALRQAIGRRNPPKGLIHHSDRGCQYASHGYQNLLKEHGFLPSMSRKGDCYDNACMESFFHTLKVEHVNRQRYWTRSQARQSIFEYIEVFYNRVRLHSTLGYVSPYNYEKLSLAA